MVKTAPGGTAWTDGPSLTWDALRAIMEPFKAPRLGAVLVDWNIPADLCVQVPRDEVLVRRLYGHGPDGDEAWALLSRALRQQDFAVVIPLRLETEFQSLCTGMAVSPVPFGSVPVYRVRSMPDAPWRRELLSSDISGWLMNEFLHYNRDRIAAAMRRTGADSQGNEGFASMYPSPSEQAPLTPPRPHL